MLSLQLATLLLRYDVVISAGHEGRPASCARFPQHHCNLGARDERTWTPIVADAVTKVLRRRGISVARLPADFSGTYRTKVAIFIHFDGSDPPCRSGASIGYARRHDALAAYAWRRWYGQYWPFRFEPDNFTEGLRNYYAFRQVDSRNASLVLELGEITCPAQRQWLATHLQWEGEIVAHFINQLIANGRGASAAYSGKAP